VASNSLAHVVQLWVCRLLPLSIVLEQNKRFVGASVE